MASSLQLNLTAMTTNTSFSKLSMAAFSVCLVCVDKLAAQSGITAVASAGPTNVEVNGSGLIDLVDPYIKPIAQYTVGLQYEQKLSGPWSMVTGAQYTSRGFSAREQWAVHVLGLDLPLGASMETRLHYLEVPLMLQYNFSQSGVTPYLKAGASASYALDGKITPKLDALVTWTLPSIPINLENDLYNRFDVSAIAGAGVRIPVGASSYLQLEGVYRHSLNDMLMDQITDIRIKSHGWSAGIGYTVRF